jgi:hypothetical protein
MSPQKSRRRKKPRTIHSITSVVVIEHWKGRKRVERTRFHELQGINLATVQKTVTQDIEPIEEIAPIVETPAHEELKPIPEQRSKARVSPQSTLGADLTFPQTQNSMLNDWIEKADSYMNLLLGFEHIGPSHQCAYCGRNNLQLYRCLTCMGTANHCQSCTLIRHQTTPFHRVVLWDDVTGCFRRTSLASLGLVLSVGHSPQFSKCPNATSPSHLTAVHTNGLHDISIRFCGCSHALSFDLQLFGYRLFPSTVNVPNTAFSFEVLEEFRYHHLEGKGSAYTFMNALCRLTNDRGAVKVDVRF